MIVILYSDENNQHLHYDSHYCSHTIVIYYI